MVLLIIPVLAFVGFRWFFTGEEPESLGTAGDAVSEEDNSVAEGCAGGTFRVEVAVAPEIFGPLQETADRIAEDEQAIDGRCLEIDVEPVDPAEVYATRTSDKSAESADDARLWVPDTADWLRRTEIPDARVLSPSIAMSPLVLATTKAGAEQLSEQADTWEELAFASKMAISDPAISGVAQSALVAIQRSIPADEAADPDQAGQIGERFGKNVLALLGNKIGDVSGELDSVAAGGGPRHPVPATEQRVFRLTTEHPDADLAAVYPRSGTVALDYPLVALSGEDEQLDQAGAVLARYAGDDTGRGLLRDAGFRAPDGTNPPDGSSEKPSLLDGDAADAREAVQTWTTMSIDTNMLAVIDLSGSMRSPVGDGRTRVELARDAAQAALAYFPDSARIGLWGFSVERDGRRDYEILAPFGSLVPAHRQALAVASATMVERIGGGTGLYDTILAAYDEARANYDPERINSIVLLTDGRNEDDPGGISKERLLAELKQRADPAEPVAVVFVGMGPEADVGTLTEIARAVGGQAYRATSPADMEDIVTTAFLQRPCSDPACS